MNVVDRAKNILTAPGSEWFVIKSESLTVAEMFKNYAVILAAIPAVAGLIGFSFYHVPVGSAILWAIFAYILGLIGVYVISFIVDALAPSFGSTKDMAASTKVVVFSYTAAWVAGISRLIPALSFIALIGAIYSLYLMYKGLPIVKDVPQDKLLGYFIVIILLSIVVYVLVGAIAAGIAFSGMMMGGM